ncbi:unnamed protein product [Albugo candida]|uniref:Uncharacterized protein n=1 Tax=Albugo candida TaxID=65357 RepID=A0A024GC61_9STRA|nr:unnamed protein product [Albugo candida]|eukprot:CCI44140.1 unnamed protein product [Albugo candida]
MFSQVSNVSEGYDIKQPINPGVHGETGSSYLRTGNLNERFWSNIHESTVKALNKVQDRERKQEEIQAFLQASRNVEGARSRPSNQFIRGHDAITRTSPLAYARKEERVRQYCGVVRRIYSKIEENKCMEEDKRPSIKRRASIENERSPSPAGPASGHNYCCDIRSVTMASSKSGSEESLEMDEIGDQALLNAMDRLSGIISKNSDLFSQNNCIEGNMLNSMVQKFEDMRQHQRMYLDRLVNIEERRANAMEAMLQYKIRKEERKVRDATYLIELQTTRAHDTTDSRRVVHCGSS